MGVKGKEIISGSRQRRTEGEEKVHGEGRAVKCRERRGGVRRARDRRGREEKFDEERQGWKKRSGGGETGNG